MYPLATESSTMTGHAWMRVVRTLISILSPPFFLLVSANASGGPAWADTVVLTDGRRLDGTVRGLSDGTLHLETDFSEVIKVKWSKVAGVETQRIVRLRLEDGRTIEGRLALGDPGILLVHQEGKEVPEALRVGELSQLNEPGTIWSGQVTVSAKVEDGNTNKSSSYFSGEAVRETDATRLLLRMHGGYEEERDEETERNFYGLLKLELLFTPAVFAYASDEIQVDRFEELVYRDVASVGAGYILAKSPGLSLSVEAGPAYITEELRDGTKDSWFGGRIAVHFRLKLPLGLELRDDATGYPNFETSTDWQFHNEARLSTRLLAHWHFSISAITDVDHQPVPGKERHDNKYVMGLGYRF